MNGCYNAIKFTGLLSNFLYMLLAICVMSAAGLGLQVAEPNTEEHMYFVQSLVLGAIICMIVIFGCYGMICDLLSVNVIFTCLVLLILSVEYVQVHNYKWRLHNLERAWHQVEPLTSHNILLFKEPEQCCQDDDFSDYKHLHLHLKPSCYKPNYPIYYPAQCVANLDQSARYIEYRDNLLLLCIIGLEGFILIQSITLSILLYKIQQRRRRNLQLIPPGIRREPRSNHVGSRTQLFPPQNV